ncbi:hypothetical protein pb186bvf_007058 [Paramecium bursaria]
MLLADDESALSFQVLRLKKKIRKEMHPLVVLQQYAQAQELEISRLIEQRSSFYMKNRTIVDWMNQQTESETQEDTLSRKGPLEQMEPMIEIDQFFQI